MTHHYKIHTIQWLKCMTLEELELGLLLGLIAILVTISFGR